MGQFVLVIIALAVILVFLIFCCGLRVVQQYERGVLFLFYPLVYVPTSSAVAITCPFFFLSLPLLSCLPVRLRLYQGHRAERRTGACPKEGMARYSHVCQNRSSLPYSEQEPHVLGCAVSLLTLVVARGETARNFRTFSPPANPHLRLVAYSIEGNVSQPAW